MDDHEQVDEQGANHRSAGGPDGARLKPGDELAYSIEQGRVVLAKVVPVEGEDPFAGFDEWRSADDAEAYGGL